MKQGRKRSTFTYIFSSLSLFFCFALSMMYIRFNAALLHISIFPYFSLWPSEKMWFAPISLFQYGKRRANIISLVNTSKNGSRYLLNGAEITWKICFGWYRKFGRWFQSFEFIRCGIFSKQIFIDYNIGNKTFNGEPTYNINRFWHPSMLCALHSSSYNCCFIHISTHGKFFNAFFPPSNIIWPSYFA